MIMTRMLDIFLYVILSSPYFIFSLEVTDFLDTQTWLSDLCSSTFIQAHMTGPYQQSNAFNHRSPRMWEVSKRSNSTFKHSRHRNKTAKAPSLITNLYPPPLTFEFLLTLSHELYNSNDSVSKIGTHFQLTNGGLFNPRRTES